MPVEAYAQAKEDPSFAPVATTPPPPVILPLTSSSCPSVGRIHTPQHKRQGHQTRFHTQSHIHTGNKPEDDNAG